MLCEAASIKKEPLFGKLQLVLISEETEGDFP
jgi:hypothetical protein